MHEIGIMQDTLRMAFEEASRQKARHICQVRMRVGTMSGVVPDALRFAFDVLSRGTIAEGAEFQVDEAPANCHCRTCRKEFEAADFAWECPTCGETDVELIRGREIELASLEVS